MSAAVIGSCECPIKGCAESVPVFRYADNPKVKNRLSGRLYCLCPAHGRIENQTFLSENSVWNDKPATEPTEGAADRPEPEKNGKQSPWLMEFWK